jgi:hypothetical protein
LIVQTNLKKMNDLKIAFLAQGMTSIRVLSARNVNVQWVRGQAWAEEGGVELRSLRPAVMINEIILVDSTIPQQICHQDRLQ